MIEERISKTDPNLRVELKKVKISEWKGALAMVRNKSQGAD